MKLTLEIYARRPLGRQLAAILDVLARYPPTVPTEVGLFSRSGRTDLSRTDVVASAAQSASDTCTVAAASGDLQVRWMYGPHASAQSITGRLDLRLEECPAFKELLLELCLLSGGIYACCDRASTIDADTRLTGGMLYREQAFVGVYWFNYFGNEYREALRVDDTIREHSAEVRQSDEGLALFVGADPAKWNETSAKAIGEHWPAFQKYRPGSKLTPAVTIDYQQVRQLEQPRSALATIASIVGPADTFIASVSDHARRFHDWAQTKGLSVKTEADFRKLLHANEPIIRDELLIPAIAAYGELVRANSGGVWRKAAVFHRGEPIVVKPGRPWTARRVILEVLESLE